MIDFNEIIYIKSGNPKTILINNELKKYIVAEVNVNLYKRDNKKILIDYCVNVDANTFDFFKTLNFRIYKVAENFTAEPIGSMRNIIISPTIANIQSFFLYDEEVCRDCFKYIAVAENTGTIGNGVAILNNSNLRVTIF